MSRTHSHPEAPFAVGTHSAIGRPSRLYSVCVYYIIKLYSSLCAAVVACVGNYIYQPQWNNACDVWRRGAPTVRVSPSHLPKSLFVPFSRSEQQHTNWHYWCLDAKCTHSSCETPSQTLSESTRLRTPTALC